MPLPKLRLHPQFKPGQKGIRTEIEDGCHLASHTETAVAAQIGAISAAKPIGAVRVDEGGEEACGGAVKGVNLLITKRLLQLSHLIKKNQFPIIFIFL